MKSMDQEENRLSGIGSGAKAPGVAVVLSLVR